MTLFSAIQTIGAQKVKIWDGVADDFRHRRSEFTVYKPENAAANGIGVIICPGGSYSHLALKSEGRDVALWLNEHGVTAFVLRYRVAMHGNHHPAMIEDLQRTMQLVKENASEYGVLADKIGVMGFSAGGHLSGMLGTYHHVDYLAPLGIMNNVSLAPAFVAMIYPVVSMQDGIAHGKSLKNLLGKEVKNQFYKDQMSLEINVPAKMPPVFITACRDDATVNYLNSVAYAEALSAGQRDCAFYLYEHGDHGYGINPKDKDNDWPDRFVEWLNDKFVKTGSMPVLTEK